MPLIALCGVLTVPVYLLAARPNVALSCQAPSAAATAGSVCSSAAGFARLPAGFVPQEAPCFVLQQRGGEKFAFDGPEAG
jgi:hypothetical protein